MSMLAEPKRKVKWSLNPRGHMWANDESKFGQKLLEKMGWKKGKGLGKSENGRTGHIKVTYKNDSNGIGFDDSSNNWIPHQDEFNAILAKLNSHCSNSESQSSQNSSEQVSLEQRSRSFKARVHYQKFVLGKDVSRYSTKDMECIFGGKQFNGQNSKPDLIEEEKIENGAVKEAAGKNTSESTDYSSYNGVATYTNSSSISDYFANKIKKNLKLKKLENGSSSLVSTQENDSSSLVSMQENDSSSLVSMQENDSSSLVSMQDEYNIGNVEVDILISDEAPKKVKKKKKKRKRSHSESDDSSVSHSSKKLCISEKTKPFSVSTVLNHLKENLNKECSISNIKSKLKSCLKGKKYDQGEKEIKHVTFNKKLRYFKDGIEGEEEILNKSDENVSVNEEVQNDSLSHQSENSVSETVENESNVEQAESNSNLFSEDNPKGFVHSNDNSWAVSQKLAMKMGCYKSVLEKIKKHKILSTTNLLDIKGYGNW